MRPETKNKLNSSIRSSALCSHYISVKDNTASNILGGT